MWLSRQTAHTNSIAAALNAALVRLRSWIGRLNSAALVLVLLSERVLGELAALSVLPPVAKMRRLPRDQYDWLKELPLLPTWNEQAGYWRLHEDRLYCADKIRYICQLTDTSYAGTSRLSYVQCQRQSCRTG